MSFLLIKAGRSPENDVVFSDPSVSAEHLEIFVDVEGNAFLTDLHSENGTKVNGVRISDSVELKPADTVTLGNGVPFDWEKYISESKRNTITVGRLASNDIVVDFPEISDKHVQLFRDLKGNVFITDLDSENGTFINGERLNGIALLDPNDKVKIARKNFYWIELFPDLKKEKEEQEVIPEPVPVQEAAPEVPVQEEIPVEVAVEEEVLAENSENNPSGEKLPWYKEHKDLLIIYGIDLLLLLLISWQMK